MVPTYVRNNAIYGATPIDPIASTGPFLHINFSKSAPLESVESTENMQLFTIPTAPPESPMDEGPNTEHKKWSCGFILCNKMFILRYDNILCVLTKKPKLEYAAHKI